ncbi:hypothetical protein M405DRAFT_831945 [Rhizopogon salebrosus TDB-379]|nr:hypothetical protein M405DRAFT_831945 [Rhizopogon salebrosus TDB-379]
MPMLRRFQLNLRTPVDYRKAFLVREMIFILLQHTVPIVPLRTTAAVLSHSFQDPVHVRSLIIFHYAPIAQGPMLINQRNSSNAQGNAPSLRSWFIAEVPAIRDNVR